MENKVELLKALAVCAETTGTELSEAAVRVMAQDLSAYPHAQVMGALSKCRREVRKGLTLADILSRLDDGRPGPQEAWATVAPALQNESVTIVWTDEMSSAFGVALDIEGDKVAARMAFLEAYNSLVQMARDAKRPVIWSVSLGHDRHGRDGPLLDAVAKGRLSLEHVTPLLIGETAPSEAKRLADNLAKQLKITEKTYDHATKAIGKVDA